MLAYLSIKWSVDDPRACQGVVFSRAVTILRSIETHPLTGRFVHYVEQSSKCSNFMSLSVSMRHKDRDEMDKQHNTLCVFNVVLHCCVMCLCYYFSITTSIHTFVHTHTLDTCSVLCFFCLKFICIHLLEMSSILWYRYTIIDLFSSIV